MAPAVVVSTMGLYFGLGGLDDIRRLDFGFSAGILPVTHTNYEDVSSSLASRRGRMRLGLVAFAGAGSGDRCCFWG